MNEIRKLVDFATISIWPMAPLIAINWAEISPYFCKFCIIFDVFYEDFELFIPFRCVFRIFLCEIIFLEKVLKWPFVPDADIIVDEVFDIRVTSEEPEKLVNYTFCEDFFVLKKREGQDAGGGR